LLQLEENMQKRMLNPLLEHTSCEENVWVVEQKGYASAKKSRNVTFAALIVLDQDTGDIQLLLT
jgi:hypothetical protein